jgi:outer membrane protein insertion porin family
LLVDLSPIPGATRVPADLPFLESLPEGLVRAQRVARAGVREALAALLVGWTLWLAPSSAMPQEIAAPAADLPLIAVLPFRVFSAKSADTLGDSVADLLRTRLEASGRVRVLDAAATRAAAGDVGTESDDEALRATAQRLAVDHVVTGSITELAGRYSLDVRATSASAGVESFTQVFTAASEDELLGRVNRIAERLIEHFAGAAPSLVARVEIRGAAGFEATLLEGLATQVGQPYDALTLRADLAALRGNPLVVSVDAETERGDAGVTVRFNVVLAAPDQSGKGLEARDRIAEVRIEGNRRIEADAIRARIASRAGAPFNPVQIARDISEIYALGFFRDVRVFSQMTPQGRVLIYEVEENPVVRQISISGNDNIESDKIRDVLTLTTGSTLDQPLLYENRQRIEALYRAQGYYLAKVSFEIEPLGEASVAIDFKVDENKKLKLRKISFQGNKYFSDRQLREGFQTRIWRFYSRATSWFDRSGTYSEPLFLQDLRSVEKKYTDAGFLQVDIGQPTVIPSKDGLEIVVNINEGRQFRVGKIQLTGDSTVDLAALRGKLKLHEGDTFNRSYLTEDISALTAHYQDRGFYFAQVTPLSNLSESSEVVDITFDVRKGPLYFIRDIEVAGNTITVDPVIRREIPIVEGQLYSQRAVQLARTRVERLGYFEEVDFKVEPTKAPDQLDLKVNVVERPTGSFSFGAGFSSQDGLVLTGSLAQSNLFGRGYAANLSLDLGRSTQRFFLSLNDPYFMGTEFSLGATLSRTKIRFNSFNQEQVGADIFLGHALSEDNRTRGFLRYSFNLRRLADTSRVNGAALIFREVLQNLVSTSLVGTSLLQDTRDDRLAPTAGRRLAFSLDGAGLGGFSKFVRAEARGRWFLGAPRFMLDRSSFVVGGSVGWAEPLNLIGDFDSFIPTSSDAALAASDPQVSALSDLDQDLTLPLTERYFLGGLGAFQLRGFKARSVGPRRPILKLSGTDGSVLSPVGYNTSTMTCDDTPTSGQQGNGNGVCNDINARSTKEFADLKETDVVGGNKFLTTSFEYRFPVSESIGLQGVLFIDMGNAFDERTLNLFDVTEWRYGTGAGVQWFSPFGPLAVVLGFPLDRRPNEKSPVFEFSVGGGTF